MKITAADVMIRDVAAVTVTTSLRDVSRLFHERQITGAPVISEQGELVGVISESDIARKANSIGEWSPSAVGQIMSRPAITVPPSAPLSSVCHLMVSHRIHRVIVEEDGNVRGIVTSIEILRAIAGHLDD